MALVGSDCGLVVLQLLARHSRARRRQTRLVALVGRDGVVVELDHDVDRRVVGAPEQARVALREAGRLLPLRALDRRAVWLNRHRSEPIAGRRGLTLRPPLRPPRRASADVTRTAPAIPNQVDGWHDEQLSDCPCMCSSYRCTPASLPSDGAEHPRASACVSSSAPVPLRAAYLFCGDARAPRRRRRARPPRRGLAPGGAAGRVGGRRQAGPAHRRPGSARDRRPAFPGGRACPAGGRLRGSEARREDTGEGRRDLVVRFVGVRLDRCSGALAATAVGSAGSRASFRLERLHCADAAGLP